MAIHVWGCPYLSPWHVFAHAARSGRLAELDTRTGNRQVSFYSDTGCGLLRRGKKQRGDRRNSKEKRGGLRAQGGGGGRPIDGRRPINSPLDGLFTHHLRRKHSLLWGDRERGMIQDLGPQRGERGPRHRKPP